MVILNGHTRLHKLFNLLLVQGLPFVVEVIPGVFACPLTKQTSLELVSEGFLHREAKLAAVSVRTGNREVFVKHTQASHGLLHLTVAAGKEIIRSSFREGIPSGLVVSVLIHALDKLRNRQRRCNGDSAASQCTGVRQVAQQLQEALFDVVQNGILVLFVIIPAEGLNQHVNDVKGRVVTSHRFKRLAE